MNEIVSVNKMLPDSLQDLSKFVLVGREKLNAVRAEIRAINKVGLAREVYEQKLSEAQDIAEAVLDAEMQIGKLTAAMPKASGGDRRSDYFKKDINDHFETKAEQLEAIGITEKQKQRFEALAKHPEEVQKAKETARKEGAIVTRQAVFDEIKKPHVANNSGDNEWYTPAEYIEAARRVMGSIDLDPASNDYANKTVKATTYYTQDTNGLDKEWFGNVWLNPPYSTTLIKEFVEKLTNSNINQAVVLVNNATDTAWFKMLVEKAAAVVFTSGRIRFEKQDGAKGAPLQGQAFVYFGENVDRFIEAFERYGWRALL